MAASAHSPNNHPHTLQVFKICSQTGPFPTQSNKKNSPHFFQKTLKTRFPTELEALPRAPADGRTDGHKFGTDGQKQITGPRGPTYAKN